MVTQKENEMFSSTSSNYPSLRLKQITQLKQSHTWNCVPTCFQMICGKEILIPNINSPVSAEADFRALAHLAGCTQLIETFDKTTYISIIDKCGPIVAGVSFPKAGIGINNGTHAFVSEEKHENNVSPNYCHAVVIVDYSKTKNEIIYCDPADGEAHHEDYQSFIERLTGNMWYRA